MVKSMTFFTILPPYHHRLSVEMPAALTLSGASASIRPLDMTTSRLFA
jgi:hypothetical protein